MNFESVELLARDTMVRELMRPLAPILMESGATEVVINRPGEALVEIGPVWRRFEVPELDMDRLLAMANAIATFTDQQIGPGQPLLSATLPAGERIQMVVPPAVEPGRIAFAIRIPGGSIKPLDAYTADGTFAHYVWARNPQLEARRQDLKREDLALIQHLEGGNLEAFFIEAVKAKKNIAVVGDTGSGKTTLMKAICQSIPVEERLITIEDVRELYLPNHTNVVNLLYSKGGQGVAKVTPADLIAANMRLKPSRVLLAELRGGEAFDFLKLLTTGHSGSITSFHAESCTLAGERYVFMAKEHEQAAIYDARELKRLVALTVDVIVHIEARVEYGADGEPLRKYRAVTEVQFDPVAKLVASFGDATLQHH